MYGRPSRLSGSSPVPGSSGPGYLRPSTPGYASPEPSSSSSTLAPVDVDARAPPGGMAPLSPAPAASPLKTGQSVIAADLQVSTLTTTPLCSLHYTDLPSVSNPRKEPFC